MGIKKAMENNFPVGECIKGCYLKKISYKEGTMKDGEPYKALIFSILHEDDWVSIFIKAADPKQFETEAKLEEKKYKLMLSVERILKLYLDTPEMIDFKNGLSGIDRTFEAYSKYYIDVLNSKGFSSVPLHLKTSPNKDGNAIVIPVGIFIKRANDLERVLQYSDWENDRMDKLNNVKNY